MIRTVFALAASVLASVALSQSNPDPRLPRDASRSPEIELQAEASREVANDLMSAVLYVEATDPVPAQVADILNRATNDAIAAGREYKSVRLRSGNVQTYPVYDRMNKLTHWRGRADIRLEGKDFREMAMLIARLQSRLQLANVGFTVSPEARRQAENDLIDEAIGAFRARAEIVRQSLKAAGVRIRRLALNTSGEFPGPRPMLAMARAGVASAPAVEPPSFEGGTSRIQVTVTGAVDIE